MAAGSEFDRLSWRDPDGFVCRWEGRILRAVAIEKAEQVRALIHAPWMTALIAAGEVPGVVELADPPAMGEVPGRWLWLEHEALAFPAYPHEISALQLFDSASLTLRVALAAAQHGWTLKDASAWNVLHSRGRPAFVDLLSFENRPFTAPWMAYGQFVRHFLLPLMLYRHAGMTPTDVFLSHRDGVTPERAFQLLPATKLLSVRALELVVLPKALSRAGGRMISAQSRQPTLTSSSAMGGELALGTIRRLQRTLDGLRPDRVRSRSAWKAYEAERPHYTGADLAAKTEFVRQHLMNNASVLDLGCNAGEFSLLAADCGIDVVSADADHEALSVLYARIRAQPVTINPLILQIGRPTPAVGWQNREVASFLDRADGRFDCVLFLGLIHHLLVSERASLEMIVGLLDRLNPKRVILEWVGPDDPKFQQLAGLNAALYAHLDSAQLEVAMGQKFRMVARLALPSASRLMYLWER